jgi:acetoin utilization protein AcuB
MQQAPKSVRLKVSDFMTPNPICAKLTSTVREVAELLSDSDIRHLPIMDNGRLAAMISDRDMRTVTGWYLNMPAESTTRPNLTVADICDAGVISISPQSDIVDAIDLMLNHKIGALPVVDSKSQSLVGIVSYIDVLRELRAAVA